VGYLKERLQLAQDILDSVASEGVAPPLTEAQRAKPCRHAVLWRSAFRHRVLANRTYASPRWFEPTQGPVSALGGVDGRFSFIGPQTPIAGIGRLTFGSPLNVRKSQLPQRRLLEFPV
jgi:hypothetical protein